MFGDEGESESGADPVARLAAAGEAFEDLVLLVVGDPRAGVLDDDEDEARLGRLDGDAHWTSGVLLGVGEKVAEHALEADPVDASGGRRLRVDLDRHRREPDVAGHPPAQLGDVDRLEVQVGGAGIDARQLEEVEDHPVEPADLADDHVDSLSRPCAAFRRGGPRAPRSRPRGR